MARPTADEKRSAERVVVMPLIENVRSVRAFQAVDRSAHDRELVIMLIDAKELWASRTHHNW